MPDATKKYVSNNTLLYFWQKIKPKFTALETGKVDKVEGKGLSTNDLTDALLEKINNAGDSSFTGDYDDLDNRPSINNVTLTGNKSLSDLGITSYVDTAVAGVVNSAPAALDTLNELAAALGNDANFSTTVTTALGNKVNTSDLAEVTNAEVDTIVAS